MSVKPRELVRGMAPLLAGAGAAQVVSFAALPVLTRLYGPADFGSLAFFGAAALLAGLLVCGRYELAVPIPAEDTEARALLALATRIGLVAAAVAVPIAFLLRGALGPLERFRDVAPWMVWVPPSLLLTSLYQPLSYWFTRKSRFRSIAATRAAQSAGTAAAQIALGSLTAAGPAGLVAGALAGQAAATLGLEIAARSDAPLASRVRGPGSGLRALARRYREFPLFTTPAGLLQLAADQLPLLLVPALFGLAAAGAFALPARLLQALVLLVAAPAAQVFYPLAARHREADMADAARRVQRMLLAWTVTPALIAATTAEPLFALTFGDGWHDAARFYLRLLPWFITAVPFAPLSQLPLVRERPRDALLVHLGVLLASIGGLLALAPRGDAADAILAFATLGATARLAALEAILRGFGARPGAVFADFGRALLRAAPFAALAVLAARLLPDARLLAAAAVALLVAHAAIELRAARREDRDS